MVLRQISNLDWVKPSDLLFAYNLHAAASSLQKTSSLSDNSSYTKSPMQTEFYLEWRELSELFSAHYLITPAYSQDDQDSQVTSTSNNHLAEQSKKIIKKRTSGFSSKKKTQSPSDSKSSKGFWMPDEDAYLRELVDQYGPKWSEISSIMKTRTRKQVRDRYNNYADPNIKHGNWTEEEIKLLRTLHEELGNKWCKIAKRMPGRTENQVKNHYRYYSTPKQDISQRAGSVNEQLEEDLRLPLMKHSCDSLFRSSKDPEEIIDPFKDSFRDINFPK